MLVRLISASKNLLRKLSRSKQRLEKVLAEEAKRNCLPVSRHGLQENGVKCPRCGHQAVPPGDWRKIHRIQKKAHIEEAVCCWGCNAFLMASPDDDIDPIKVDEAYDRNIYHRFVRPEGMSEIIQEPQLLERDPVVGDWVHIISGTYEKGEGRIEQINGPMATVRLSDMHVISQANVKEIPVRHLRVMVFECYHIGMRMRVDLGPYAGQEGRITWQSGSSMLLTNDQGQEFGPVIQEHVTRLDLEPVTPEKNHA